MRHLKCHQCELPAKWLVGPLELPECEDHFLGGEGEEADDELVLD